jgi:hypothetical protein
VVQLVNAIKSGFARRMIAGLSEFFTLSDIVGIAVAPLIYQPVLIGQNYHPSEVGLRRQEPRRQSIRATRGSVVCGPPTQATPSCGP